MKPRSFASTRDNQQTVYETILQQRATFIKIKSIGEDMEVNVLQNRPIVQQVTSSPGPGIPEDPGSGLTPLPWPFALYQVCDDRALQSAVAGHKQNLVQSALMGIVHHQIAEPDHRTSIIEHRSAAPKMVQ